MYDNKYPDLSDIPEPFRTNLYKNASAVDNDITAESMNFSYSKTPTRDMIFLLFILIMFYG